MLLIEDRWSASPTLITFDRDGKEISRFSLTIPGAGLINLYDNSVAFGKDGSLAIVGTTDSSTFVASVSADRRHQTVTPLTDFFPQSVTMPSDHTIWVSGYKNKDLPRRKTRRRPSTHTSLRPEWEASRVDRSAVGHTGFKRCCAMAFNPRFLQQRCWLVLPGRAGIRSILPGRFAHASVSRPTTFTGRRHHTGRMPQRECIRWLGEGGGLGHLLSKPRTG